MRSYRTFRESAEGPISRTRRIYPPLRSVDAPSSGGGQARLVPDDDQVPRVEAAAGAGAGRVVRRDRAPARRSTCSRGRHGSRRSSSGAVAWSPRSTPPATPRCSPGATSSSRPTRSTTERSRRRWPTSSSLPGDAGLLHRDVLRAVAVLPAVQRRAGRRRSATPSSATTPAAPLYPILLTSLIEAADRVDSTTGVQMAYVKHVGARGRTSRSTCACPSCWRARVARCVATPSTSPRTLGPFDLAYLDPPYNQHRYFTNYHVWETLVAWDAPEHYGVACKRRRRPRRRDEERVQRQAGHARRAAHGDRSGRCPSRRGLVQRRVVGDARRADRRLLVARAGSRCWRSTRSATSVPRSASTTRPAPRWVRCRTCATWSTWSWPARRTRWRGSWPHEADSGPAKRAHWTGAGGGHQRRSPLARGSRSGS